MSTLQPHTLCKSCKSYWEKFTNLDTLPMPTHILHSKHRSDIRLNASSGCHFCSIILGSVTGCTGKHLGRDFWAEESPIYISTDRLNEKDGTFLLTLFPCEQAKITSHDLILNDYPLRLGPSAVSDGFNSTESSIIQTSTFSEQSAEFIKSWILQCQNEHVLCGDDIFTLFHRDTPKPKPKRLLDLLAFDDAERIKLVDAETTQGADYCALSYSWGFSKPFVMTSSNLPDFQQEIQVADLPRTIRDAVQVVRGIGFRYLWIDALCIMQDGKTSPIASIEWYDQVNKLHDIFGNAVLTIAASESFDGDQGFIKARNPLAQTICQLYPGTKIPYEVVPPCTPHCLIHPFDNARYHLDSRAWVFQERILSPRTAHISRNMIHLECRTELKCETGTAQNCHHSGTVSKADYQAIFAVLGLVPLSDAPAQFFLATWHDMVRRYSTTNLCRSEDLLVAIAGLAIRIQRQSQFTWSFGLWREYMLQDLLWYVRGGIGMPCRQRAPSWSWASVEVQGPQIIYDPLPVTEFVAKIMALPETSRFEPQVPLIESEPRYVIKLSGPLKQTHPRFNISGPNPKLVHRTCLGLRHIHRQCPFHPDYELLEDLQLYSLLIGRNAAAYTDADTDLTIGVEVGLILAPTEGASGRYTRVGYFHHTYYSNLAANVDENPLPPLFGDFSDVQEIEIV